VDFVAVAADALLNHAAKIDAFSGGRWKVPMVVRMGCGGGYGDGGQHEQSLWGWLAHIPGLKVVVPSNPADAGGLMLSAIEDEGPVLFMEHKLLADYWIDYLADGGRTNLDYDIPQAGIRAEVPKHWEPIALGEAKVMRHGEHLTIASVGVSVHRCLAAAHTLEESGVRATVIDLRSIAPLDTRRVCESVEQTGHLLVVDEDYKRFSLSGELAAALLEAGIGAKYARVAVEETIPFDRRREAQVLPNVPRILDAASKLVAR
jgi:pyruvate dehydrogenase E1 component beta subunit